MADVGRTPGQTGTDRRICPQCQAENPASAEFCWRCFARFGVHPGAMPGPSVPGAMRPAPTGTGELPPPPAPSAGGRLATPIPPAPGSPPAQGEIGFGSPSYPQAPAGRRASAGSIIVRVVLAIIVVSVVSVGVKALLGPHINFPESIDGMARNHDATAMDFEQRIQEEADRQHVTLKGAMYGPGNPASFAVVAGGRSSQTPDETFQSFADGLSQGSSGQLTVDLASKSSDVHEGVTYQCAPVTGAIPGGLCMWQDGKSTGFVQTFDRNAKATRGLIGDVRSAVLS